MKRCPGCGAILAGDDNQCGVCGADLWRVRDEPLEESVKEEEAVEAEAEDRTKKKDLADARRMMMATLVVYVVTAILIVSGFLLVFNSPPIPPLRNPSTPFGIGFILILLGFAMLLYVVIGPGPSERRARFPWGFP